MRQMTVGLELGLEDAAWVFISTSRAAVCNIVKLPVIFHFKDQCSMKPTCEQARKSSVGKGWVLQAKGRISGAGQRRAGVGSHLSD